MFIEIEEFKTHLYTESITAISGDDEDLLTAAIDGAVAEAKGYLHKFDLAAIFTATTTDRHPLLLIFVKDIAIWHYINLANPGIDYTKRESRYKAAVAWLKGVQQGDIVPDLPVPEASAGQGDYVWGSNPKRDNHV